MAAKKTKKKIRRAPRTEANTARAARPRADRVKKAGAKAMRGREQPTAKRDPKPRPKDVRTTESSDDWVGKKAPAFELADGTGAIRSSASLAGKPYVLYFYPKDDTPGCTREACDFRDGLVAFQRAGVSIFGVSPDSSASHARFAEKHGLPFTLLSDPDKKLVRAYEAWGKKESYGRQILGIIRSTFLVDARGVVRRVWRGVRVDGHARDVLEAAHEL